MPGDASKRFGDLLLSDGLNLSELHGEARSEAIEAAYENGTVGVYLTTDSGDQGRAARWLRDEFREFAGDGEALFGEVGADPLPGTETGYLASIDAFTAFSRDKATDAKDWLFQFTQGSGDCVGASGTKLFQGSVGTVVELSRNTATPMRYLYVPAMWAYSFRGSCGQGWYMAAHASVTLEHGYAFALPSFVDVDYDDENDSETYTVSRWCRDGAPQQYRDYVDTQGWRFEQGAITEFSGGIDELKAVIRAKGQIHHGSHYTGNGINNVKRIGGHAQTFQGGFWDDRTLKWFRDLGYSAVSEMNFPCINTQQWGPGWSGECPAAKWPPHWGPKPEGAWIVFAQTQVKYFSEGYVYLPRLKAFPGTGPQPPQPGPTVQLTGTLTPDLWTPMRGVLTATCGDAQTQYILVPDGNGNYKPQVKTT